MTAMLIFNIQCMPKKQLTYFRTMRLKSGLTQADIAALIGTSPSQISRIEGNRCIPTCRQLLALSIIYGHTACDLMAGYVERLASDVDRCAQSRDAAIGQDITARSASDRMRHIRIMRSRLH